MAQERYTRGLEGLRSADAGDFGAKSASLGELIASEIPVPAGFAISSVAYRDAVAAAGGEGDGGGAEAGRGAKAPPLSEELLAEIAAAYERLAAAAAEAEPAVAVRSSALGEDAEGATFAGQHETYLWVRGADGVCAAVRDCWASLHSAEAVSYRERMAAGDEAPAMGVAVQAMVDAAVSGVMFTCNPVSGDPSTVAVNASWGLGLGVVGGEVTPDEYRVSKVTGEVLQREIGAKQVEFLADPGGAGTVRAEVSAERRAAPCLDDDRLEALVELARRVERHFGSHQDIEWAIARGDGALALLQSRPVTGVAKAADQKPVPRSAIEMVMGTFGATGEAVDRAPATPAREAEAAMASDGEPVEIVDTTTRDGNQSLWSATGLKTPDVLEIAPAMDRVGYHALDFTSSTHMAVSVRYHREDPWERIRLVSEAMPQTPLSIITTGMRFISWTPAGEDVMRLVFRCVASNGIRRMQIADPSNDPDSLIRLARMAREEGTEEVVVGLTYSISPVHTHDYYAERARAVSVSDDIDRLYLKDPGGLLTTEAVAELGPAFIDAVAPRPAELHSHCTIGLGPRAYEEGLRRGIRTLHTATPPLADGTSNPPVRPTLDAVEAEGLSHRLDRGAIAEVSAHFEAIAEREGLPPGAPREFDRGYYEHQMPGGMVTTTKRHLEEIGKPELFDATLEEVTRVRAEMGYPIMVTPVSQFVATQAVMNVISKERWSKVGNEMARYFLGHFYEPAAPVDPEVADKVLAMPRIDKLRALEPLGLEGARERFGEGVSDEELLLRLTMPADQVDAMLAETAQSPAP